MTIGRGVVTGHCYGSLINLNLKNKRQTKSIHEEGVMQVTFKMFQKRTNELPKKVMNKGAFQHKVLIVQAPFCVWWYFNDRMYFSGDQMGET